MAPFGQVKRARPPLVADVVREAPRRPRLAELDSLIHEWLELAVRCLWRGDINSGAAYFTAAMHLALKVDLDSVDIGARLGYWDFCQLCDWVDEARAAYRREGGRQ